MIYDTIYTMLVLYISAANPTNVHINKKVINIITSVNLECFFKEVIVQRNIYDIIIIPISSNVININDANRANEASGSRLALLKLTTISITN